MHSLDTRLPVLVLRRFLRMLNDQDSFWDLLGGQAQPKLVFHRLCNRRVPLYAGEPSVLNAVLAIILESVRMKVSHSPDS